MAVEGTRSIGADRLRRDYVPTSRGRHVARAIPLSPGQPVGLLRHHGSAPLILALQTTAGNAATSSLVRVQRFGSLEHKSLGDTPTGSAEYEIGGAPAPGASTYNSTFRLTHGDIVALTGDYFDPRDDIRWLGFRFPNPDSLFRIAARPSSAPGTVVGTRDEIVWTIYHTNKSDPRFAPGGKWNFLARTFSGDASKAVRNKVHDRYLKLASRNIEHFVNPTGAGPNADGPLGSSAHASYRQLHKRAVLAAWEAGSNGKSVDMAKAREAAAQHFLTDSFAAGHLRTPRLAIRGHWSTIYPLFWANLKKKIAHDMAVHINEHQTNAATLWANVMELYEKILAKVEEQAASKPALGFDNIVALAAHDLDNETGLMVTNDFGSRWKTYGDSNLGNERGPQIESPTEVPAHQAVVAGVADIEAAHAMGAKALTFLDDGSIFAAVKARPGAASMVAPDKFEAEKFLPRIDESAEPSTQSWKFDNVDDLWKAPIRSDLPDTYGTYLTTSLREGELHDQLADMANDMKKEDVVPALKEASDLYDRLIESGAMKGFPGQGGLYRDKATIDALRAAAGVLDIKGAYEGGFLQPLMAQPLIGLRKIVDFNPSLGQASWNTDDAARSDVQAMKPDEKAGLTLNQRTDRIKALVDGTFNFVGEDDGKLVIELFETAKASDRAQLYRLVEGHAWDGNWRQGFGVDDDEIWNGLNRSQLKELRTIINGG
jgi:hypothetical protein